MTSKRKLYNRTETDQKKRSFLWKSSLGRSGEGGFWAVGIRGGYDKRSADEVYIEYGASTSIDRQFLFCKGFSFTVVNHVHTIRNQGVNCIAPNANKMKQVKGCLVSLSYFRFWQTWFKTNKGITFVIYILSY